MKIGIVGIGVVGGAIKYGFEKLGHQVSFHDVAYNTKIEDVLDTNICFVCVPTPSKENGACDIFIVENVIKSLEDLRYKGIVAIKSTVNPGTTEYLQNKYHFMHICFVPEFLRERCAVTDFMENHDVCIIGTHYPEIFEKVKEAHGKYPKQFVQLMPTEAEFAKYFNNIYNATLITFANSFYELCKAHGIDYSKVKDAVVNRSHITDVYLDCNENIRGFGGMCLLPETLIYTFTGLKPIKDIAIGDYVLTHTGSYKKVTKVYKRIISENINSIKIQGLLGNMLITDGHSILGACAHRRMYSTQGRQKLSSLRSDIKKLNWIESDKLLKGDFVSFPTPNNLSTFKDMDVDLARLLGYYLAEGSIYTSYYVNKYEKRSIRSVRTAFTFHAEEIDYHKDVCNIISRYSKNDPKIQIKKNTCSIRVSDKKLAFVLSKFGGHGAQFKKMPWDFINTASDEVLANLLVGYFRGDGSSSCDRYTCATISKELFEQIKFILFRLQLPFTTKINKRHIGKDGTPHKESYCITIASKIYMDRFSSLLKDSFKKRCKTSKIPIKIFDNKLLYPIKSIDRFFWNGVVYNLEVAQDNSYVTYHGIVHNCLPKDTKAMAYLCKKLDIPVDFFQTLLDENNKYVVTVFNGMRKE